ncbi:MAG TPA: hypothetical protein VEX15_03140 [Nocardioidaceae bacterium]|nr:hypothetical protein [Nocardioidaceae bacterium]
MVGRKRSITPSARLASALAVASLLTGCGSAGAAPQSVASEFYQAVADEQASAACDLLAPQTRSELEQSAHAPCAEALIRQDLPTVGAPMATERFGNQAQVRFDGETAFLAEFDDGWKIVAAGCTPRDPLPYDCVLEGV